MVIASTKEKNVGRNVMQQSRFLIIQVYILNSPIFSLTIKTNIHCGPLVIDGPGRVNTSLVTVKDRVERLDFLIALCSNHVGGNTPFCFWSIKARSTPSLSLNSFSLEIGYFYL
jgi:hypothetical protein